MSLQKTKPIRSQKLRDSAQGESCTFQIIGVCNSDPDTTVLCHLPDESHGMSRKSDDLSCAYGCSACHDAVDARDFKAYTRLIHLGELDWHMRRAMVRTLRRMIEKGLIKIA